MKALSHQEGADEDVSAKSVLGDTTILDRWRHRGSMAYPSDEELRQLKGPSENHFVERKTASDAKDWLKTVVAFANSTPLDRFAVLYIGVRDDGTVERAGINFDSVQKTLERRLEDAYPRIPYTTRVLTEGAGDYLCVVVAGSSQRPHFSGPAFVRSGSQTINASAGQFERLITERNSKGYSILRCRGKRVSVAMLRHPDVVRMLGRVSSQSSKEIVDCSNSTLVLREQHGEIQRISLDRVHVIDDPESECGIVLEILES